MKLRIHNQSFSSQMRISWLALLSISTALLGTAPIIAATNDTSSKETVSETVQGVSARPMTRENPKYPYKAVQKGIEGWVLLSFVVEIDGTTSEVVVLDSSPSEFFEMAAIEAVSKWTYEPAQFGGEVVRQSNTRIVLSFEFENGIKGASRFFHKRYKDAQKAVNAGDLETADKLIAEIDEKGTTSQYENAYFEILQASVHQKKGELKEAIGHLKRAVMAKGDHLERKHRRQLLRSLFALQVHERFYPSALQTYETIKNKTLIKDDDPLHKTAQKIRTHLDEGNPIAQSGSLIDRCPACKETNPSWYHSLYYNKFYIDQVEGQIDELSLYCGYHWARVAFDPELSWTLNERWGKCDIHVLGKEGTIFRLVEFR